MEDEKEDMEDDEEDEEIDLEEMTEDDLKSFIEDVIADMVESGELEAGEEFESEDEVEDNEEIDVEDDTEVDVEVNEAKEDIDEAKEDIDEAKEEIDEVEDVEEAKKDDMEEIMAEIAALKAELHETNLLNAKLLYTNKIFRAKNLKEAQKVKVLEAFDKASNVKEVKLIFETLNEGMVSNTKTIVKENLGSASKPAGVATKAPIVEVDPQVARWQKLAGIK